MYLHKILLSFEFVMHFLIRV